MKGLAFFVLCSGFGTLLFAQNAQNTEALIREMTGAVELKHPGQADWIPARAGDRVGGAAIISTGFKSTAVLSIGNSTLTVRPLTRLSLETLMNQGETETINIGLQTGRVRAEVRPPAGGRTDFTVRTPMVTASVRGTVFDLDPVNLWVSEGTVRCEAAELAGVRPVLVSTGQRSQVDSDTGRTLSPLAAAEMDRALPAMAGREALPDAGEGARPENPQGSLMLTVTLEQ